MERHFLNVPVEAHRHGRALEAVRTVLEKAELKQPVGFTRKLGIEGQ
jgi:hypothetical protein